jgi:hypothetical protein
VVFLTIPGLLRIIPLRSMLRSARDTRTYGVKPAGDRHRSIQTRPVIAGLDPAIHLLS